jgi:hypothetical protein
MKFMPFVLSAMTYTQAIELELDLRYLCKNFIF